MQCPIVWLCDSRAPTTVVARQGQLGQLALLFRNCLQLATLKLQVARRNVTTCPLMCLITRFKCGISVVTWLVTQCCLCNNIYKLIAAGVTSSLRSTRRQSIVLALVWIIISTVWKCQVNPSDPSPAMISGSHMPMMSHIFLQNAALPSPSCHSYSTYDHTLLSNYHSIPSVCQVTIDYLWHYTIDTDWYWYDGLWWAIAYSGTTVHHIYTRSLSFLVCIKCVVTCQSYEFTYALHMTGCILA